MAMTMDEADSLCDNCCELDLESFREKELDEISIGTLAEFCDQSCPFCRLIGQAMHLAWGKEADDSSSNSLELFLQSKSPFAIKQRGRTIYPHPRLLLATDKKPESFSLNRAFNRETDRTDDRFIIAEVEFLPDSALAGKKPEKQFISRCEAGTVIDGSVVKKWIDDCQRHAHSIKARSNESLELFEHKGGFRLIDVIDGCLVNKKERCDYVALSYVWGIITPFKTLKSNYELLCVAGSLSPDIDTPKTAIPIPKTILDAIRFTKKIGIRYLWVDAICIIQDDYDELGRLIGRMDDVYDNAAVTIIAASGIDANAGLPGVSTRGRNAFGVVRAVDSTSDTTFNLAISYPTLSEQVRSSIWNTRGWTFQESCLSQRCLYFTEEEVFFNCSQEQHRERYEQTKADGQYSHPELRTGPPWWSKKQRKDPDPTPYHYMGGHDNPLDFMTYQGAVQDYSRKQLTKAKDVLNAFTGIFNRFNRPSKSLELSIKQVQGIPIHLLYLGLLWFPAEDAKPRSLIVSEQARQDKEVPIPLATWSWVSWIGAVEYMFTDSNWLTRVISYAVSHNKPVYPAVAFWNFGDSEKRYWSHPMWRPENSMDYGNAADYFRKVGIDTKKLLEDDKMELKTAPGEWTLGFIAAHIPSSYVTLEVADGARAGSIDVHGFKGGFRFDGYAENVSLFVLIVAGDTIKDGETFMVFLGLVPLDGVTYRRVGVGFLRNVQSLKGVWEYSYLHIL